MRKRNCVIFLTICILLFACGNPTTENAASNLNKTGDQNISAGGGNFADNSTNDNLNANAKTKTNAASNANDTTDFKGTAGSTGKKNEIKAVAVLREVRTGRHDLYDRVTFEFAGAELPSYYIEYIDKPVRDCGSGNVVNLKGDGWLEISFEPAAAHTEDGKPTIENREQAPNFKIINELKLTCDFEAVVTWVLGVSSPNKYRVLELENPTRLAIDIKY